MPSDHGFRRNDDQALLPARPDSPCHDPEELVERSQARPRVAPFENCKLLAQGQVFEQKALMSLKDTHERSKAEKEKLEHT